MFEHSIWVYKEYLVLFSSDITSFIGSLMDEEIAQEIAENNPGNIVFFAELEVA